MAKSNRISKRTSLNYFYLNGEPHKVIKISRSEDLLISWNYDQKKRVTYVWSVAKRDIEKGFTMKSVASIFNRNRLIIHRYIQNGNIKRPKQIYSIETGRPSGFLFSKNDMRDLHEYLLTVHRGRPRKDGEITNSNLVSRAELEALMNEDKVLYTKDSSGEFVPVWKQPDW